MVVRKDPRAWRWWWWRGDGGAGESDGRKGSGAKCKLREVPGRKYSTEKRRGEREGGALAGAGRSSSHPTAAC
ncbi:hypothetical protein Trydic_g13715 [Trypoxylus dichotomus]